MSGPKTARRDASVWLKEHIKNHGGSEERYEFAYIDYADDRCETKRERQDEEDPTAKMINEGGPGDVGLAERIPASVPDTFGGQQCPIRLGSMKAAPVVIESFHHPLRKGAYSSCLRFDKLTSTIVETTESPQENDEHQQQTLPHDAASLSAAALGMATGIMNPVALTADGQQVGIGNGEGGNFSAGFQDGQGRGDGSGASPVTPNRPSGKDWLRTHPRGTPPTMKLAMQFDQ